jgi:hypothetical protein
MPILQMKLQVNECITDAIYFDRVLQILIMQMQSYIR